MFLLEINARLPGYPIYYFPLSSRRDTDRVYPYNIVLLGLCERVGVCIHVYIHIVYVSRELMKSHDRVRKTTPQIYEPRNFRYFTEP